jgi:hypothetical protein
MSPFTTSTCAVSDPGPPDDLGIDVPTGGPAEPELSLALSRRSRVHPAGRFEVPAPRQPAPRRGLSSTVAQSISAGGTGGSLISIRRVLVQSSAWRARDQHDHERHGTSIPEPCSASTKCVSAVPRPAPPSASIGGTASHPARMPPSRDSRVRKVLIPFHQSSLMEHPE